MSNGFLSTNQLDFFTLKENLKEYLRGKPEYADFDFDGSNLSTLLDILSYNTYLNAFYLNQIGSEQFLDTAQIRASVVSHAKELNYLPRSRRSARALVNLTIDGTGSPSSITIPRGFRLTTVLDNTTLTFTTNQNIIVTPVNSVYSVSNVEIFEGEIVTEFFNVPNTNTNIFKIQSENVDISSVLVDVITSETDNTTVRWERANNLFGLTSESNTYFIEGFSSNRYQIAFSPSGVFGRRLSPGNIVRVQYRDTIGTDANGASIFNARTTLNGRTVSASTVERARFGAERESRDEIKFNAPRFFQTQERAVVDQDWETIVRTQFPEIQSVIAYGGELTNPPQYGKVIITPKPFGTEIATTSLKNRIINALKLKNLTTEPIIVDPDVYYVEIRTTAFYNPDEINVPLQDIRNNITTAILNINNTTLNDFDTRLRYSRLTSIIDNSDSRVVSNDTSTRIIKRISPVPNANTNYKFSFGNAIKNLVVPGSQEQPLGHAAMLDSTPFTYTADDGVDYLVRLQDNGRGTVFLYTRTSTGTIQEIESNIGTINYSTGEVDITLAIKGYDGQYISIYGRTVEKDIVATRSQFLIIDSNDLVVTLREAID